MYSPSIVCHKKTFFTSLILLFIFMMNGFAQRYSFKQFDIEDGLTQSQVTAISQDSKRRLWITTLGGLSCFNGKHFCSYTKTNGLNNNFALTLSISKNNDVWVGNAKGLSRYNGEKFINYKQTISWVSKLVSDQSGAVYGLSSSQLFKVNEEKNDFLKVTDDTSEMVTALRTDADEKVWAAVYHHGIYVLENKVWKASPLNKQIKDLIITDFIHDRFNKGKIWLLSTQGLFVAEAGRVRLVAKGEGRYTVIEQDGSGNIWIGSAEGAYYLTRHGVTHFTSKNGFSDNTVNTIFKDAENNIWLGTDGAGLFRFKETDYVIFDETQGLKSKVVMSLAKGAAKDEIWLGTYAGLYQYKNNKIKQIPISNTKNIRNINFLYNDKSKNIWIGTVNGGLWCYNGTQMVNMAKDQNAIAYNAILEDGKGQIWLSTNLGCFLLDKKSKELLWVSREFGSALLETNQGEIILGTQEGAYLIDSNKKTTRIKLKQLAGSSILSLAKLGDNILFGTADNGLLIWNNKTGQVKTISTKEGLASDHVYSILIDPKGIIWLGTGKGVNTMNAKDFKVIKDTGAYSLLVECNQNAILRDKDKIWVGTTKGAVVYNSSYRPLKTSEPFIYINSVVAFAQNRTKDSSLSTSYDESQLSKTIVLPHDQNNITIDFTGIFLTNPDGIFYQYRLIGLDNTFSETISNTSMNFTAVPPGKYTFEVKAITRTGIESLNTASFSFEVTPPYYQTSIFRLVAFLLIILLILLAVYVIITLKERKRRLRLKIKLEEQFNVRKQTAEDFHDDLGNKLTRISVLSEVLNSMIDVKDTEKRNIIRKINENVNDLYTGTKDILWSLNPKNDKLTELIYHIQAFGIEMFNDTPIRFEYHVDMAQHDGKLSLDMSRNILMIFKEAIHNALKHSKAQVVSFTAVIDKGVLEIVLKDDGQGFNNASSMEGHGINNMNVRAKRINARLNINSATTGTVINLNVNFSTLMRLKNV